MRIIKFNSATVYWDGQGLPFIVFTDGKATYALPRKTVETETLGYTDVALGNFEHEALHVFLNEKLPPGRAWISTSVLYRAATGVEFVGQVLQDAIFEESLVVGLQVAMNQHQHCDSEGNTALPGFCYHLARGCYLNAKHEFEKLGLDIDALAAEARSIIRESDSGVCTLGNSCLEVPTTHYTSSNEFPHPLEEDVPYFMAPSTAMDDVPEQYGPSALTTEGGYIL
jgi:hypothetical protein